MSISYISQVLGSPATFFQIPDKKEKEEGKDPAGSSLPVAEGTHLSLGILTVFFGLLLRLIRAPGPPVPLVSGTLSSKPDLPPGQSFVSYLLFVLFWFILILIYTRMKFLVHLSST